MEAYRQATDEEPPHLFFYYGWLADYPDPDNLLRVGFPWDWTGWSNEAYHTLVQRARRLMDHEERMRMYRQADLILVQDAAFMPCAYSGRQVLVKPWVSGFVLSASGQWDAKDVVIASH
jgi:dipeptide transport system substrate-binding protein